MSFESDYFLDFFQSIERSDLPLKHPLLTKLLLIQNYYLYTELKNKYIIQKKICISYTRTLFLNNVSQNYIKVIFA